MGRSAAAQLAADHVAAVARGVEARGERKQSAGSCQLDLSTLFAVSPTSCFRISLLSFMHDCAHCVDDRTRPSKASGCKSLLQSLSTALLVFVLINTRAYKFSGALGA